MEKKRVGNKGKEREFVCVRKRNDGGDLEREYSNF